MLQILRLLAKALQAAQNLVLWCKRTAARVSNRAAALALVLTELQTAVLVPGQGVELRLVESLSNVLVLLAMVWLLLVWVGWLYSGAGAAGHGVATAGVGRVAVQWSWCCWPWCGYCWCG
jgi:hypothetical protein